jgi:hypothetical protein
MSPVALPRLVLLAVMAAVLLSGPSASAHGLKSALLTIEEAPDGTATLFLKLPLVEDRVPHLEVSLPAVCTRLPGGELQTFEAAAARVWRVRCEGGLTGKSVEFVGLGPLVGDVLVRERGAGGEVSLSVARADAPSVRLGGGAPAARRLKAAVSGYLALGARHVLTGIDHLLFVLGLLLIVRRRPSGRIRAALGTVTAFTVAHSITLALAALGKIRLAPGPVELTIALSILLLAVELAPRSGVSSARQATVTHRWPWAVAFAFGLLHGFGFAGALRDIGFPEDGMAVALLLFNLGVEVGQLVFVGAAAAVFVAVARLADERSARFERLAVYGIGAAAAYFCMERFVAMGWSS